MLRFLLFFFLFQLANTASAQNYYQVTFPNDTTVIGCGATIDTLFPAIINYGSCGFNVGVSVTDQTYSTPSGGACTMIYRKYHLIYWCDYDPNTAQATVIPNPPNTTQGPTVFGTVQNHGDLQYTQIIKILDSDGPTFLNCPSNVVTACDYTTNDPNQWYINHHDYCEGPVKLEISATDLCSGSNLSFSYKLFLDTDNNGSMETVYNSNSLGAWPIVLTSLADTMTAKINFSPNIQLPYGRHKIQWTAKDYCGHERICQYEFIVKDCAAPTVVCLHGISVNLMPGGMITIPEADLLEYTFDNCTPNAQIKTGVRASGTGSGFPLNQHEVMLTCANLGVQNIEVWAQDEFGNADFCTATVQVQDHIGACAPGNKFGQLKTDKGLALAQIPLQLKDLNSNQTWSTISGPDGYFSFAKVPICGLSIGIDPNFINLYGVNVADALQLERHLLHMHTFNDPYRVLTADINHDHTLSGLDLNALIQKILSSQSGQNWALLPQTLQLNANPLLQTMPSASALVPCNAVDSMLLALVSLGDIDGSWANGQFQRPKTIQTTSFFIEDRSFAAGETFDISLLTPDLDGIPAFQFMLDYDENALELLAVQPNLVQEAHMLKQAVVGTIACLWYDPYLNPPSAGKGLSTEAFSCTFRAKTQGKLSDFVRLNDNQMIAAAFNRDLEALAIHLQWQPEQKRMHKSVQVTVFPNPAHLGTTCTVNLDKAQDLTITLIDGRGATKKLGSGHYEKGEHSFIIDNLHRGTYYIKLVWQGGEDLIPLIVEKQ